MTSLEGLFAPRGIVVVGASADADKLGGAMARSLATVDHVSLVNARGAGGMHVSLAEAAAAASSPLDLGVLCVPAAACAQAVRDCAAVGVTHVLICAGGFAEVGPAGAARQAELEQAVAETGVRVLGPNTSGFFVPPTGLVASFVPAAAQIGAGGVAVVAASGGLNHALAFAFQRRGVGLSLGAGIGAGFDVAAPEVLRHCADDPATTVVALHLESVPDGDALLEAVRYAARRKPVVALVVGQHDIGEFAQSHTGALATSWRTTRAVLAQAGAVVVEDEQDLVVGCAVLAATRCRPSPDPGAALVTAQAGPGLLVADALLDAGVALPTLAPGTVEALGSVLPPLTYQANPVDTGRPGPRHHEVLGVVAADEAVDLLGVYALAEPVVDLVDAVTRADLAGDACVIGVDGPEDEVVRARVAAARAGVALVVGPSELALALDVLAQDSRLRHAAATAWTPEPPAAAERTLSGPYSETAAKDLLDSWGVPTPRRVHCTSEAEVVEALGDLGAPVVVKLSSATVLHKSDVGGVRLGVTDTVTAAEAYRSVTAAARAADPVGSACDVLVEQMAAPGVDLIVGARRDPVFGPVVLVGLGGVAAEVYADVALATVPASPDHLSSLLAGLRGSAVLNGFRGLPPVDRREVARVASVLGDVLLAHPEVDELEVNPLRATASGLVALDAVLVTRPPHHEEKTS